MSTEVYCPQMTDPGEIFRCTETVLRPLYEQGQQICEGNDATMIMADHRFNHAHRAALFAGRLISQSSYDNLEQQQEDKLVATWAMLLHDIGMLHGRDHHEEGLAELCEEVFPGILQSHRGQAIIETASMHNGAGYRKLLGHHIDAPYAERREVLMASMTKPIAAAHNADKLDVGLQRANYWNLTPEHFGQEPTLTGSNSYDHLVAQAYSELADFHYNPDTRIYTMRQTFKPYLFADDFDLRQFGHVVSEKRNVDGKEVFPLLTPHLLQGADGMVDFEKYQRYQGIILGDKFKRCGEVMSVLHPDMDGFQLVYDDCDGEELFDVTLGTDDYDQFFNNWLHGMQ